MPNFYIAIHREDGEPIDKTLAESIKTLLDDSITEAMVSGRIEPEITSSGLVTEGYYFIEAANEETMNWLMKDHEIEGYKIKAHNINHRISLTVPNPPVSLTRRQYTLLHNTDTSALLVGEWELICKKPVNERKDQMILSVPEAAVEEIRNIKLATYAFGIAETNIEICEEKPVFVDK